MNAQLLAVPVDSGNLADLIQQLTARGLGVLLVTPGAAVAMPATMPTPLPRIARLAPPAPAESFPPRPVAEVITAFMESKRQQGVRPAYATNMLCNLRKFAATFGESPVASITVEELEEWLGRHGWKAETRRSVIMRLRVLFGWCLKRGYVASNIAEAIDLPARNDSPPGIVSAAEAAQLMAKAAEDDPQLAGYFALQLFAGLRASEAASLVMDRIKAEHIEVTAKTCKTRRRRLVPINATMRAWLPFVDLPIRNVRERINRVRDWSGVSIPHNALRHSFVSYSVPVHGAALTASWAGHTEEVLFRHYRELVSESDAKAFWAIRP